ncbi:toxin ParE1/3/4 [Psychroflexus sediminis]|uniref:Toxin ParE1/3/4 n=1 Tax=Psychroflexus sediminis TaxID=470826 RepID=A0A1G7Z6Y1_9FLAO|nr:toxin ParE1/3/4 [Psychroflexus sediminis]
MNRIWYYTLEKWSEKQADTYYAALKLVCNRIGENPNIGKEYYGISKNLLGLKSGKHIIFYQSLTENKIEVIRILHERMDLKNKLTD